MTVCTASKEELKNITAFSMEEVVNEDKYCVNALEKEVRYLVSFDLDRLLAGFRENAGLDMKGKSRYDGWENMLIGGHTMGHYLTAMAQAYENPGVTVAEKEKINTMLDELLDGLLECQKNSKGKPGFLFGATINDKSNVEAQFDFVEENKVDIFKEAWVPWYTMHKILAGVIEVYKLTGKEKALSVAKGLGDWTFNRSNAWDKEQNQKVLNIEYGGMNDCLYELYSITQEERYAVTAHRFDEERLFERVWKEEENCLTNIHANTTIPKYMGALNRYVTCHGKTICGEKVDASKYLNYVEKFWQLVLDRHTYVTGGNSEWEHFREDYKLNEKRTNCNCETCNVHNMLKLSRMLFRITGNKKYADYYERAYINAILPSQNPETGMSMYFQPMATGYYKTFSRPWDNFWCCTGTGMENFTKLNDSIFFHNDQYIFVNLYESATLKMKENGVVISMKADLQKSDEVSIVCQMETTAYGLALRIPEWIADEIEVSVEGNPVATKECNGFLLLEHSVIDGHELRIKMPMKMATKRLPDSANTVAFQYGPFVLSGNLGTENMESELTGVDVTIPATKVKGFDSVKVSKLIKVEDFIENPSPFFEKENSEDGLTMVFSVNGLRFNPHYNRYKERYGLYFELI